MRINSLKSVTLSIKKSALVSLFALVTLSLGISNLIYLQYITNNRKKNTVEINANTQLLESYISEKISIVASSNVFIDYLRSGTVSRQKNNYDFLDEMNNLNLKEISGMIITKSNNNEIIFTNGKKSPYYVVLPLCYLDRSLDSKLGECTNQLTVYLEKKNIISNLRKINPNLTPCPSCNPINFIESNKFGSFDITSSSKMPLFLSINESDKSRFIFINLFIVSFMVALASWTWRKTNYILDRHITKPISAITNKLKNSENLTKNNEIDELIFLIDQIEEREEKLKAAKISEKTIAIGQMATQVAHDIRSPLAALNVMINEAMNIPEQQRILIRNATQQVNDIANNLLQQHSSTITDSSIIQKEPISILLDSIISEKRSQYKHLTIDINFNADKNAYNAFATISVANFKRALSNILNNAIEAIPKQGAVCVSLSKTNEVITITIKDNGIGMTPDILSKISAGNATSTKKNGTGIGFISSKRYIEKCGGIINIDSQLHIGTTVTISIPATNSPDWFADHLIIPRDATFIILDDDKSIHDVWKTRINNEIQHSNIEMLHFFSPTELLSHDFSKFKNIYYFFDYELIGDSLSGLDVIEQLHLTDNIFLVTSRYNDNLIREKCSMLSIKIIPKQHAPFIPINPHISRNFTENKPLMKIDLILIDDNKTLTEAWRLLAIMRNKKIVVFNTLNDARTKLYDYDLDTLIYIDSDLKADMKGEEFAKTLFSDGFTNIYLTTGNSSLWATQDMYWIKGVLGKNPAF